MENELKEKSGGKATKTASQNEQELLSLLQQIKINQSNIFDYEHFRIDINSKKIFLSYPFTKYLYDTYIGDSKQIKNFLKYVTQEFFFDIKKDKNSEYKPFNFVFVDYTWFIYDNEDFKNHLFEEV
ncbi:462_t:CDS:2, partial [Racocetra persica]